MKRLIKAVIILLVVNYSVTAQEYLGIYAAPNINPLINSGVESGEYGYDLAFSLNTDIGVAAPQNITVTAEYTDQQYTDLNELPAPHDAMLFGAQSNNTEKILRTKNLLVPMSDVGTPIDSYYTPKEGLANMDVNEHYSFEHYLSTEEFVNLTVPTVADATSVPVQQVDYYMGKLTYTFSEPVDNPILHVVGLGGLFGSGEFFTTQLFSVDYELVPGAAESLTLLSGTEYTALDGNTITNTATFEEWATAEITDGANGNEAGSGSFVVNGTNITSVTFNLNMVGKSPTSQGYNWSTLDSEMEQKYSGDRHNTTWTLPLYDFGGSVVIDNLQNGSTAPDDGGSPYTSSSDSYEPLYAVLVDENGDVTAVVPVDPTDGTFDFTGVLGDEYTVQIQTTEPVVGDPAPVAATLPSAYETTEEEFIDGGADSEPNSITNPFLVGSASVGDITDENLIFGIKQMEILPVEWVYIKGEWNKREDVNTINWATASEINSDYYVVERRYENEKFEDVGRVAAAGNSTSLKEYLFNDKEIASDGKYYYRLKQYDLDGSFDNSATVLINVRREGNFKTIVYPNPAYNYVNINIETSEVSNVQAVILDVTGKLVMENIISGEIPAGRTDVQVPLENLSEGAYVIRIISGQDVINHKVLVLNN